MEILSDEEEEEEEEVVVGVSEERYRPQSLDKMIALVALLVEKSRGENNHLQLMHKDYNAIIGGKVSWLPHIVSGFMQGGVLWPNLFSPIYKYGTIQL